MTTRWQSSADRRVSPRTSPPELHSQVDYCFLDLFPVTPAMRSLNIHELAFDIHVTEATSTRAITISDGKSSIWKRRALVAAAALRLMPLNE
jgi:hypothetical protein